MPLIDVRGLNLSFRSEKKSAAVIADLSFHIMPGEVFGLVGESGSGKSMTAFSIMGLLPSNAIVSGEIVFKGRNLLSLDQDAMREVRGNDISMIFQEPMTSLNPVLNIGYQIAEVLMTHRNLSKKNALEQAIELLRLVRIPSPESRIREFPHQMSGGMRQRIMIAMSIACNPALLIADEPTTALDVTIQAEILRLIDSLRREHEMSVLFITHDLGIVAEITDRVGVMYAGRIVETATTEALLEWPMHPYTMGLLESLPVEKGKPLKPIKGTIPVPGRLPEGCTFSDRCAYVIDKCHEREPDLEATGEGRYARCIRSGEIQWNSLK